ncbi:hypothetical protein TNCT_430721 [Trichonephila clavata]|uniref:Uncharacterized protein n=1 Tax=Trichonephila clavata TaxID=2740835 RepID=A0A8X6GD77_TRICU|nr:hypothetical protein TNCT_430721 [Trichonephila clavata]
MRTIPSNALFPRNYFPRIWPQVNSIPERNAEQTRKLFCSSVFFIAFQNKPCSSLSFHFLRLTAYQLRVEKRIGSPKVVGRTIVPFRIIANIEIYSFEIMRRLRSHCSLSESKEDYLQKSLKQSIDLIAMEGI